MFSIIFTSRMRLFSYIHRTNLWLPEGIVKVGMGVGQGIKYEFGIDMHTLPFIK